MKYIIHYEKNPGASDIQFLNDGIMKEHKIKKDMKSPDFFAYFIRDDQGQIAGGCAGDNMYGGLFVGQLWVREDLRGKGYGKQLMSLAEDLAIKSQCRFIAVNTFEWEALSFYKKLGFYVEFKRSGFDKDSVFYFLRKDLISGKYESMKPILLDFLMPIMTPRLILRPPQTGDGVVVNEAVLESFDQLHQLMPWAQDRPSIHDSEEFARQAAANWILKNNDEPYLPLFMFDREENRFVGGTGYHHYDWNAHSIETGYWIRKSCAGQGLMTEAVNAITQYAFKQLDIRHITIKKHAYFC